MNPYGYLEIFSRTVPDGEPTHHLETAVSKESSNEPAEVPTSSQDDEPAIGKRLDQTSGIRTRILVVDDHEAMRKSVRLLLNEHSGVEIVGEVGNGKEAVESARTLRPDMIIMDVSMPVMDGLTAAQIIKKSRPQTAILMFSTHKLRNYSDMAKRLGLDGYVSKSESVPAIHNAFEAVRNHQTYFAA